MLLIISYIVWENANRQDINVFKSIRKLFQRSESQFQILNQVI